MVLTSLATSVALSATSFATSLAVSFTPMPVDFDTLPRGAAPQIPWYVHGAIHGGDGHDGDGHDGDGRVELDGGSIGGFVDAAGGFVVHVWAQDTTDDEMLFVGAAGREVLDSAPGDTHDLFGPVASDDGQLIVWSDVDGLDGDEQQTRLVLADGVTGEVLRTETVGGDLRPVGFLGGGRVVLRRGTEPGAATWTPLAGSLSPWPEASSVSAVSESGLAAVVQPAEAGSDPCTVVVDVRKDERLWRTCELRITGFSPHDSHAVGLHPVDGTTTGVRVVESRSGEMVAQTAVGGDATSAWETDDQLLLAARQGARQALVRWQIAGSRCAHPEQELATEPIESGSYLLPTT